MDIKVKYYKNISYYKGYRSNLLSLMHPNAYVNAGKIVFKQEPHLGLTGKLWKDQIFIEFSEKYNDHLAEIMKKISIKSRAADGLFSYNFRNSQLIVDPTKKNYFADTEIGMRQRASYFVFILELCLKCFVN